MRFLDKGDHFDLCLRLNNENLCFAEHFDSFVATISPRGLLTKFLYRQLRKNPIIKSDYRGVINMTQYLIEPSNIIHIFDRCNDDASYDISVGRKGDNSSYGIGSVKIEVNDNFDIIYSERSRNGITMTLYHVCIGKEFTCEKIEEKYIHLGKNGFELPCSEEEMKEFIQKDFGLMIDQSNIFSSAVQDCYSYYPNYVSKFADFIHCSALNCCNYATESTEVFFLNYWFSKPEYYDFADACIQKNDKDQIYKKNPFYTGVMPSVKDLQVVNPKAEAIFRRRGTSQDTIREFGQLEALQNVGPDGLNLILEFCEKGEIANEGRGWDNSLAVCNTGISWRDPAMLMDIFKTFNITPKQFIDRTIREMFYNDISSSDYWRYICDYINMCYSLNIEVEDKIPKDVIHRHDMLAQRLEEIKDAAMMKEFSLQVIKNKKLLENLPDGSFTIICPETSKDLIEEGLRMNHCVGSYGYSYASGNSKIFFVREKNNIDYPVATLELDRFNRLVQISARSNYRPSKDVMEYVEKWLDIIRKGGN